MKESKENNPNRRNDINLYIQGKALVFNENDKPLKVEFVSELKDQCKGRLLAPNYAIIKGKDSQIKVDSEIKIYTGFVIQRNDRALDYINIEHPISWDLAHKCLKSHDNKERVDIIIKPFTIRINTNKSFKLTKVNNINQVGPNKIYAPNGFDLYINNVYRASNVKYIEYDIFYSYKNLKYHMLHEYESNNDYNYNNITISEDDIIELRFYED